MMKKALLTQLYQMFPLSSINSGALPEEVKPAETLMYVARITPENIHSICAYCTDEDPSSSAPDDKSIHFENWKSVVLKDPSTGEIIVNDDGSKMYQWEPTQFHGNRVVVQSHVKQLYSRFTRYGYHHALRDLVFSWEGQLLDGQYSLLALWHLFTNTTTEYVDVGIKFIGKPSDKVTEDTIFRLFDQAMRKRTLKDVLSCSMTVPEGFEAEIAGTLRFSVLLASGKGINSSIGTLAR